MMLHKPGYEDQRKIWLGALKSELEGSTPTYCIYHGHLGEGHFSAMRVCAHESPSASVDLSSEPRPARKCARTGVRPRLARLLLTEYIVLIDLRHFAKSEKCRL